MKVDIESVEVMVGDGATGKRIRYVSVNDERLTIAGYKQLESRAYTGSRGSKLLGWVNWHPDGCDGGETHAHFLWLDGDGIYRDRRDSGDPLLGDGFRQMFLAG